MFEFLDQCIIRFVQRPVKYYEDLMYILEHGEKTDTTFGARSTSLLFATLMEQWPFIGKSAKADEKLDISRWLARYLGYSKQTGEDAILLTAVRDKLVHDAGSHERRAVLKNAFQEQSNDVFPSEQRVNCPDLHSNSAVEPQPVHTSTLDTGNFLRGPPIENEDHPGLSRWMRKDIPDSLEDGDVGELVMCFCSGYEEIRKQALVSLDRFVAKLKVGTLCIRGD